MRDETDPSGWVKGAVWVMGIGLPLLAGGMVYLNDLQRTANGERYRQLAQRVDIGDAKLGGLIESVVRALEYIESHERESDRYKNRIDALTEKMQALATDALARPDPFTGTEGRELERRIDTLEHLREQVKHLAGSVDGLAKDQREARSYYQNNVVPLIQQSNQLQMQQIQQGMTGARK